MPHPKKIYFNGNTSKNVNTSLQERAVVTPAFSGKVSLKATSRTLTAATQIFISPYSVLFLFYGLEKGCWKNVDFANKVSVWSNLSDP